MPRGKKRADTPGIKQCAHCENWKETREFGSHKGTRDGLRSECRECTRRYHAAHYLTPKGKWANWRGEPRVKRLGCSLTFDEWVAYWQKPCTYCHRPIKTVGLDRVDNTRGYEPGNVVPCCATCNGGKGTATVDEFREWVAAVYLNFVQEGRDARAE